MSSYKTRLGEMLVSLRLVSQEQLQQALEVQKHDPLPLGTILVSLGAITEELLLNALAHHIGVSPWRLELHPPDPAAVAKLPGHICRAHQVIPVEIRGDLLVVAMLNPLDIDVLDLARNATGMRIEPVLADAQRLANALTRLHGAKKVAEDLDDLVDAALKNFKVDKRAEKGGAQITEADTRPVVGLVNQILTEAIRSQASDVHIEPRHDRIDIRYRLDGQLQLVRTVPIGLLPMLVTRLKIMAEIDIVEFRVPQDGRVSVVIDGRNVDLRVSVLPNYHGQRVVLRVLDKSISLKKLDELGFIDNNLAMFRSLVRKPYGMFLVTGPTGSGKTTTLYAALQEIRESTNNVMTCEDPVEYEVDGVNQSQVHEKVGLTFARQLRAILRQDPDVILVGEVRDGETAETAMRAALTGHLVLSTLHCNDAPSALPRLIDMGIDPFMLSTALIGVMSQRLVRQLCPHCREATEPTAHEFELFAAYGTPIPAHTYRHVGCGACGEIGFSGRAAVHEILPVAPNVAKLIAAHAPIDTVREVARGFGYEPMQNRALEMVASGRTTMEEAQRVVFLDAAHAQPARPHLELRAA